MLQRDCQRGFHSEYRTLSDTIISGLPRLWITLSNSRVIRSPDKDMSAIVARDSRKKSSTIHRMRNLRPSLKASDTKSRLHRQFASSGTRMGLRVPKARFLQRLRLTAKPSSRYIRNNFCGSPQNPLWPEECQAADSRTGGAHRPAPEAFYVRNHRFAPACNTGMLTAQD